MINIPTELLRTLVAVVDHRSFTKAAQSLGVTQPAVSAQIKRLHTLLEVDLFDRNVAGVALTLAGETVVTYARRMLSINDHILQATAPAPAPASRVLRLGLTGDYVSPLLAKALAGYRTQRPYAKFHVTAESNERLLHDLRTGELDLIVLTTLEKAESDARHHWMEEMVWGRGTTLDMDPAMPVPLVSRGVHWINHRLAIETLDRAGLRYDVVFIGPSILSLVSAAKAGLGVMPVAHRRVAGTDLLICDRGHLPELPSVVCAIYVSDAGDSEELKSLADAVAIALRPSGQPLASIEGPERDIPRLLLHELIEPRQL